MQHRVVAGYLISCFLYFVIGIIANYLPIYHFWFETDSIPSFFLVHLTLPISKLFSVGSPHSIHWNFPLILNNMTFIVSGSYYCSFILQRNNLVLSIYITFFKIVASFFVSSRSYFLLKFNFSNFSTTHFSSSRMLFSFFCMYNLFPRIHLVVYI